MSRWLKIALYIICAISTGIVKAAGFQLSQHSVTSAGRALAGTGVAGDDLGDLFANPASLSLYNENEFQTGLILVSIDNEFENRSSFQQLTTPGGLLAVPSSGRDDTSETKGAVPHLHFVFPSFGELKLGLSITSPFGLSTEYDRDWVGRFHAIKSELTTVDINPLVAYDVNENLSVGGGLSIQYADATLSNALFLGPGNPEGIVRVSGDDISVGYNFGLLYEVNDASRFGLSFRSKLEHELDGTRQISSTGFIDGRVDAKAIVNLPETMYLSGKHRLSSRWGLFGTLRWTNWSRNQEIRIEFADRSPDSVTPQEWDDSVMLALGADYRYNDQWTYRFGIARDETPIPSSTLRTPRNPDTDRNWLAFGFTHTKSEKTTIDVGGVVLLAGDRDINVTTNLVSTAPGAFTDTLVGEYPSSTAWVFGAQIRHAF
ncbi:MAG: outer membrane protein transport protein [Gammaproteobacteria bacterium]|nr:outer membrane protein transport protein [Gammaproteobacteria bacterium]